METEDSGTSYNLYSQSIKYFLGQKRDLSHCITFLLKNDNIVFYHVIISLYLIAHDDVTT